MMTIRVRVRQVDMDGFLGRDFHPDPHHVGQEGVVTNIDLDPGPIDDEHGPPTQIFYVKMDSGDVLELMGHEIELVSCAHDGDL